MKEIPTDTDSKSHHETKVVLTAEEIESFKVSLDQARRQEFASEEEVRAVWAKYGL